MPSLTVILSPFRLIHRAVRSIIEELSDAVSELMIMVIVLSEQNAAMPPDLPGKSVAINETAQKVLNLFLL